MRRADIDTRADADSCCVCLEHFGSGAAAPVQLPCGHNELCGTCCATQQRCPLCRQAFSAQSVLQRKQQQRGRQQQLLADCSSFALAASELDGAGDEEDAEPLLSSPAPGTPPPPSEMQHQQSGASSSHTSTSSSQLVMHQQQPARLLLSFPVPHLLADLPSDDAGRGLTSRDATPAAAALAPAAAAAAPPGEQLATGSSSSRQTAQRQRHQLDGNSSSNPLGRLLQGWMQQLAAIPAAAAVGSAGHSHQHATDPSITLALVQMAADSWRGFDTGLQDSLAACRAAQQRAVQQVCADPGWAQPAACWLAILASGLLLYHLQLGLQLLPIAAASLALGAARQLPARPARWAGTLLAGHCVVLSVLACCWQQTGAGLALLLSLLAATPRVVVAAGLLLWAQLVPQVLMCGRRAASMRALRLASLLCRCWCVAAAAALAPQSAALAAAAWAQKAHLMLLEAPALVAQLQRQQQWVVAPGDGITGGVPAAALLCLLQALAVLFVPPAPLAAARWLPALLQAPLAWGVRVLLCGCCVQLAMQGLAALRRGGGSGSAQAGGRGSSSSSSSLQQDGPSTVTASAPHWPAGLPRSPPPAHPSAPPLWADAAAAVVACSSSNKPGSCLVVESPPRSTGWALQLAAAAYDDDPAASTSGGPGSVLVLAAEPAGVPSAATGQRVHGWLAWVETPLGALQLQHAPLLLLLAAAFAGDAFITAAGGGSSIWVVRAAWHALLQQCMVAALAAEVLVVARREARLVARLLPMLWSGDGSGRRQQPWT